MKITAQQYISNSKGSNSYVTVFKHYFNDTERKVNKQGDIYALIAISSEKNINSDRVAKFVWDSLVDGYLYSTSPTTNESLKESIQQGIKKVKDLMTNDKDLEEKGIDISFTIVLAKEEGTYVGVFGENDIYTFKKGSLVNISSILTEKKANTAGVALEKNDILMISSSGLLEKNSTRFSNFKDKKNFIQSLDAIGGNLVGSKALIYFTEEIKKRDDVDEKREEKIEKKIIIPKIEEIKESAKSVVKPLVETGGVNESKGEPKQTLFENAKEKTKFEDRFSKVKETSSKIILKAKGLIGRFSKHIGEKWILFKEKVTNSLGRKRWYKKMAAKFSQSRLGKRKPVDVRGMRIDSYKIKDLRGKRFKLVFMFVIVVVLLVFGINFTIRMRQAREISKIASGYFEQIEDLLRRSDDSFVTDRSSAEMYLFQAENLLTEVPSELGERDQERFDELEKSLLEIGDSLYRRIGFVEKDSRFDTFIDARLAFGDGSETVGMTSYTDSSGNEYLVVADKGRKTIYRVSLYDKSVRALPDNNGLVKEPKFVYVGTQGVYVFDAREGMLKAPYDNEGWFGTFAQLSGLGIRDIRAEEVVDMAVWGLTDNVHLFSVDRKALLRSSTAYSDRYGLPFAYVENENFQYANAMTADLSFYATISESPHLMRFNYSFFEGKFYEAPLGYLGYDGEFGQLTGIYTGESLDFALYIYDLEDRAFFRFQKPIESGVDIRHPNEISLINKYVYRGERSSILKNLSDFVVDNLQNNIYILDGSVIWKLSL